MSAEDMPAVLEKFQRIIKEHNISQMAEGKERGDISKLLKQVQAASLFLTDWWLIGPFDNPDEKGLQVAYPPEHEYDTTKTYTGRNNRPVAWRHYNNNVSGYIDFTKILQPSDYGVAYARGIIKMSTDADLKIGVGSNDGARLWVNGKLVLDHKIARKAEPNQDVLTVPLHKGENTLLLKIDQLGGGWGFYFSIM